MSQLSSGLGSSFQIRSLLICSILSAIRQSSHLRSPFSNSQTCPSGISAIRFLWQLVQKINTGIMASPVLLVVLKFAARRSSQRLLNAPPSMDAIGDGMWAHSEATRPLCHGKRNTVMCEVAGRALVVVLLLVCFPSHVAWFVVPVVVDPAYGSSSERLQSHVCKEVIEGVTPSGADCNPTESVVFEAWVARIVAARSHVLPATVFARFPACSVGCVSVSGYSAPSAARACSSVAQRDSHDDQFRATLTSAVPVRAFMRPERLASISKHSELAVDVTSLVFHSGINPQWAAKSASRATARCKVVPCDKIGGTAVAQNTPVGDFSTLLTEASHYKTTKALSSKIFEIVGASVRITRRHDSTPFQLDYCESRAWSTTTSSARFILAKIN